jgi:hypothetical protein
MFALLLLALLLLGPDAAAAAVAVCTGKSASLPQSQCQALVDLYDYAGGDGWTGDFAPYCKRNDPCGTCRGCCGNGIVCNDDGTTVTRMCVCPRAWPAPRRACELENCAVTDSTAASAPPAAPQRTAEPKRG